MMIKILEISTVEENSEIEEINKIDIISILDHEYKDRAELKDEIRDTAHSVKPCKVYSNSIANTATLHQLHGNSTATPAFINENCNVIVIYVEPEETATSIVNFIFLHSEHNFILENRSGALKIWDWKGSREFILFAFGNYSIVTPKT